MSVLPKVWERMERREGKSKRKEGRKEVVEREGERGRQA